MDNLGEIGDALPQETKLFDLPYELREKINEAIYDMGLEELTPFAERKTTTEQERLRRRQIYQNTQQMHNQNLTATTLNIMNESQQNLLEAQRESIRASREYNRMMNVISHKIVVYGRLLRTRNEPPF